jgi:integrase
MKAAGNNRHGLRDATMILMAFRHGLRASELCSLRWEQVDLVHGRLHVHRLKNGVPSVHPLTGIELRALRRLQREQKPGRYVFMSERGAPMSAVAFRRLGSSWPIRVWILGRCNTISGTRTSSIRFDIANFLPSGFAISGRTR